MDAEHTEAVPEIAFPVEYQRHFGESNRALRGKGKFSISETEPRYRFTGETRAMFGNPTVVTLSSAEIHNVTIAGRKVQFSVADPKLKGPAFLFYCATPEDALAAARCLPAAQDDDFVASQTFGEKLSRLPGASSPWTSVTNVLIAMNLIVFVVMGIFGAGWITTASMTPYVLYVANNAGVTTDGEWWRLVTCMFAHYGLVHLLLNMWALFQAGHFVERLLGRSLFTLAYFGSGIAASFTSIYWHGDKIWSAGASGAVFGIYGMLLGFMLREKQSIPKAVLQPMLKSTLTFAGYNLLYGAIIPHIDNAAHIGGLAGGVIFGGLLALPVEPEARTRQSAGRLGLGMVLLLVGAVVAAGFAPRFDYRLREELKWSDVNQEPAAHEPELLKGLQAHLDRADQSGNAPNFAQWLESQAIPFYEQWSAEIDALALTPGKLTERNRRSLVPFLKSKVANLRQLATDLRANHPRAVPHFLAAEKRARAQLPLQ